MRNHSPDGTHQSSCEEYPDSDLSNDTPQAEKKEKTQKHNLSDQYRTWVRGSYSDAMETAITGFLAENPVFRAEINTAITRLFKESLQAKVDKENKETMKAFHASRAGHWGFTHVLDDEEEPSDHEDSDGGDQNSQHDDDDEEEDSEDPEGVYMDCKTSKTTADNDHRHTNGTRTSSPILRTNGKHLWQYTIATNSQNSLVPANTQTFPSRIEANDALNSLTSHDRFNGGMDRVTRRTVYEYCPLKLLKVELTLSTGEELAMWVERRLVDVQTDLTKRERQLKKWSANRPKLPHYIVECEFTTRRTTDMPQELTEDICEGDGDRGSDRVMSNYVVGAYTGELEMERLPLATFTERGLANDHAGALFLRHSAVNEAIRGALDDFWWANNAVPIHEEARKAAKAPDALYAAELYTWDMNTRLGFDSMRVSVYAVDDVQGPLNI